MNGNGELVGNHMQWANDHQCLAFCTQIIARVVPTAPSFVGISIGKVPFFIQYSDTVTLAFVCVNFKYQILSEKGMSPPLILDTSYTCRGCGRKAPYLNKNIPK